MNLFEFGLIFRPKWDFKATLVARLFLTSQKTAWWLWKCEFLIKIVVFWNLHHLETSRFEVLSESTAVTDNWIGPLISILRNITFVGVMIRTTLTVASLTFLEKVKCRRHFLLPHFLMWHDRLITWGHGVIFPLHMLNDTVDWVQGNNHTFLLGFYW